MRRSGTTAPRAFGPFVLDLARAELTRAGTPVALRPKTFALLVHLVDRSGHVVSKQELLDAVWPGVVVTDDSLTQAISELRAALGEQGPVLIRTLLRRGYRFEGEVRTVDAQAGERAVPAASDAEAAPAAPQSLAAAAAPVAAALAGLRERSRWSRAVARAPGLPVFVLAGAVLLCTALVAGVLALRAPPTQLDAALAEARSIVVLPFADLSDPPAPHLAYAVDDELATDLGRDAQLRVIARGSASALGPAAASDPRQAGGALGVRYVLAGSVQRAGEAVSINVRLLRTDSGQLLWAHRFEYPSAADWAKRREIAARIANVLGTQLTLAVLTDAGRKPASDKAIDHWMRGRYLLYRLPQRIDQPNARAELMQARAHFESARAADPASVHATAGLAFTHVCEVMYRWSADRQATLATATALAQQALALDPNDTTALKALAGAQMFDGNLEGAMQSARRQLEINPSDAHSHRDLAATLYFLGRWEEALQQLAIAERLNPLDTAHLDKVHGMAGIALLALGRYDEALARARSLEAVTPRSAAPFLTTAAAHAHRGDLDAARRAAAEVLRRRPQFVIGGGSGSQRGSTAPAYLDGMRRVDEGLRLAGLPERAASAGPGPR